MNHLALLLPKNMSFHNASGVWLEEHVSKQSGRLYAMAKAGCFTFVCVNDCTYCYNTESVEPLIKIKIAKLGGETGFRIRSHSTLSRLISVNHRPGCGEVHLLTTCFFKTNIRYSIRYSAPFRFRKKNRKCHLFDARCIWLSVFYLKSVWWCYCFLFLLLETWCVLILQMENLNGNTITRKVQGKLETFQM